MSDDAEARAHLEQVMGAEIRDNPRWRTVLFDNEEIHVHPLGDLMEHELDGGECPCGPAPEMLPQDEDADVWMFVHHSLDGRERDE